MWKTRIGAASEEHGISYDVFREGLSRQSVLLNGKVLAELACWEPFTFKALTDVAFKSAEQHGLDPKQPLQVPNKTLNEPPNYKPKY